MKRPRYILPALIVAQLCGTSLWFAGNAVLDDLRATFDLPPSALGSMTSAVQLGFIAGTLFVAWFGVADRFSPRGIFLVSACLGSVFNFGITLLADGYLAILVLRFLTGFTLAGIYPVGMKIASGWYKDGLGAALGWLVGALVLGTALPHALRALGAELQWHYVLRALSAIAAFGGALLFWLVPDGPFMGKGRVFRPRLLLELFKEHRFRAAALGYFGHMWELYGFWTLVPLLVGMVAESAVAISAWSFAIIAVGFLACGVGGLLSLKLGSAIVARAMLVGSGLSCIAVPFVLGTHHLLSLGILLVWGFAVVGDSPQFSTLVARYAPDQQVGTALTWINCFGFAITIPAIELLTRSATLWGAQWAVLILVPGPVFGLWASRGLWRSKAELKSEGLGSERGPEGPVQLAEQIFHYRADQSD